MAVFAFLPRPVSFVRARFQHWFESRIGLSDSVTLTQRTVYILPTRPGWMLFLTLLVLLVASINYQLNLGYLLTFLLAGTALVGMHVCHGTLRGLAMNLIAPHAHYAGASTAFDIKLTNSRRSVRYGIGLSVLNPQMANPKKASPPHWVWTDVPAQGSSLVQVAFTPSQRGLHRLPTLTAETRFPLGTFRVWTVWRPAAQVMVYPAPELTPPPLPPGEPRAQGAGSAARAQSSAEFDGVRGYRRGDPLKNVLWKKAAKAGEQSGESGGLVVRDTQQAERHELWLDIRQAGSLDLEHKLSRLCAWVLQADRLGLDYGLRLSALEIKPASGEAHKRRCLEALATC
ncbi:uncharacterized protein (DUF58 family) [Polaromonas sp. CG_9.5]|uniref:DUF58 domain-containing protein n=1 Tax=Polaromonas sp. CG_9.5 TaxID=3071705 RepID=UPI002DFD617B|nr:uncharacterized protein (DUF58 family) [Polaromonas sp. CG_9.5]